MLTKPIILPIRLPLSGSFGEALITGGGGSPPYPALPGYRWQRETYQGQQVLYNNQPNYYLERTA